MKSRSQQSVGRLKMFVRHHLLTDLDLNQSRTNVFKNSFFVLSIFLNFHGDRISINGSPDGIRNDGKLFRTMQNLISARDHTYLT